MMQGQVSGVQIVQNTGALGGGMTFNIRGVNSVTGSNEPLVVIDGYPVESGTFGVTTGTDASYTGDTPGMNALSSLNPNDIESIEILKRCLCHCYLRLAWSQRCGNGNHQT